MTPTVYLLLSALLFTVGAVGVLVRRNAIVVFMCIELMLNAVNLSLVTFARINGSLDGQVMGIVDDSDAGRIVAAVLQSPQSFHEDRNDVALSNCSNNSTHASRALFGVRRLYRQITSV